VSITDNGRIAAAQRLRNSPERPRQELYLVIGQHNGDNRALSRLRQAHLDFLHHLDSKDELVAAGPLLDNEGTSYHGSGCFLIKSADHEAALITARRDPYHRKGVRENRVSTWLVSEGSLFRQLSPQQEKP